MNQRIAKDRRERGDAASNHIFNDLHINHNIYPRLCPRQFHRLSGGTDACGGFDPKGEIAL